MRCRLEDDARALVTTGEKLRVASEPARAEVRAAARERVALVHQVEGLLRRGAASLRVVCEPAVERTRPALRRARDDEVRERHGFFPVKLSAPTSRSSTSSGTTSIRQTTTAGVLRSIVKRTVR